MITAIAVLACVLAAGVGGLRWLRVAQREHYLPGADIRFAARWWSTSAVNVVLLVLAIAGIVAAVWFPLAVVAVGVVALVGPIGLGLRGRTSQLAWTRRLTTLAITAAALGLVVVVIGAILGVAAPVAGVAALGVPALIDLAALVLAPIEQRASRHFIEKATYRLARVSPRVVAITGSYGKTSTKNHLASLIAPDLAVVPTPRSFNNRAGLARAVNEHLVDGTQVFIAEMGTYGPGEIAEMCSWCPPEISIITAIGPVHLERFGTLDVTVTSKAEIATTASVVVLNVDDERLASLASTLERSDRRVIRAGSNAIDAEVRVTQGADGWSIVVDGAEVASSPALIGVQPTNVACALGAAMALGLDPAEVAGRVALLSNIENRLGVARSPSGVTVVDDTFNANPAGAAAALEVLSRVAAEGRSVVVTPGMIELGRRQAEENESFAAAVGGVAQTLVIVGRTNRRALLRGAAKAAHLEVVEVGTREEAVSWVRSNLGPDDAVLYENDLPDNYP